MYPYIVDPEHLQKLINEQGHLLDKDGVNILTEQESSVEQEKILVIEPRRMYSIDGETYLRFLILFICILVLVVAISVKPKTKFHE